MHCRHSSDQAAVRTGRSDPATELDSTSSVHPTELSGQFVTRAHAFARGYRESLTSALSGQSPRRYRPARCTATSPRRGASWAAHLPEAFGMLPSNSCLVP